MQVQAGMLDHDINLPPGHYYLFSTADEYDARQEYIEHLQDQKKNWDDRLESIKGEHALFPNDNSAETRVQKEAFLKSKSDRTNFAKQESKRIEEEINSIQDINDINRASLFSPYLFGARGLAYNEREELKNELKKD